MIVLLHGARAFGAVERYAAALATGLRDRGEEDAVLVHADHPVLAPFACLAGARLRVERYPAALLDAPSPKMVAELRRILRRVSPRVVHLVEMWPAAAVAARLAGVRRLLATYHTPELPRRDSIAGRGLWRLGLIARPTLVYTSETDRARHRRRVPNVVVELGIPLERFRDATPALDPNGPVIGNVARLAPQKGQRTLLEAAALVIEQWPDARFVIVGDGELREELEAAARDLGVGERVLFTGARDDVPSLLASFDVFAYPSRYEGLCLAVIEAQAAGVPVVATPVGGIRETVVHGETGLLCEPGDPRSLAEGVLRLLEDRDEARRLVENARRRAERYSEERMVDETLRLYR